MEAIAMLTVGDKLPAFTVPVQQGTNALPAGETISDTSYEGKWKVLFYWPKDFTFVCPTEIVGYSELKGDFEDRDAVLIGASTDTAHVHLAWRKSDPDLAAADFPGSRTMAASWPMRWASSTRMSMSPTARPSSSTPTMSFST
ncbi:hypothetical protein GCM10020258_41200 [Sphingomonas yabuuchiae]